MAPEKKRGRGRPKKDVTTDSVSGRVSEAIAEALHELALIRRRSMSAEIGMAVEDTILDAEAELRAAGKWTPALEKLKAQRRPKRAE